MRSLIAIFILVSPLLLTAQHPLTFFTKEEATAVKKDLGKYSILTNSYNKVKKDVDAYMNKDVDVPVPKDPAGGYTHERHKTNYMLMFNSGVLYNLTGDARYAALVKNILLKYAKLNPTLKNHPQATSSSPGHIFWQALNDANWLVYAGMAYDLIYNSLSASEKNTIEQGAFKPEVDFFTKDLSPWFNLLHNHGVWACAGVGIVGIATNNKEYVDMALYGTAKNGKRGFIAQMDSLFSPDGYYTEGPYYVRYAILPYYLFANALQHARPELKVFEHRDRILQKALLDGLQQTNLDGRFFPLNDALKEKDYTTNEMITAIDIACGVYGYDNGLLTVAKKQNEVLLNKGGANIAAALAASKDVSVYYPYKTEEYVDGANGAEGGVSYLRNGKDKDLTTLIYKYTSHGLSHGHFDKLNYNLYDKGNEIFTDYGSVRFISVEQKYGGRYLPENKDYASQTIAHNTLLVDETSQFNGNEKVAEEFHSDKLFSELTSSNVQIVGAKEENAYKGVKMQRTLYMLQLPDKRKIIVDIFNTNAAEEHQYDLPFHYDGQLISTSFKYKPFTQTQEALGKKNGYEFLWKEAEADVKDTMAQLVFLNDKSYYAVSSLITGNATIYLTRSGANDPDFNLRREPAMIIRNRGTNKSFLNVIEILGSFDPIGELTTNSYSAIKKMQWIENDDYSIAEITIGGEKIVIAQSNKNFESTKTHTVKGFTWQGPAAVWYDGKFLN